MSELFGANSKPDQELQDKAEKIRQRILECIIAIENLEDADLINDRAKENARLRGLKLDRITPNNVNELSPKGAVVTALVENIRVCWNLFQIELVHTQPIQKPEQPDLLIYYSFGAGKNN